MPTEIPDLWGSDIDVSVVPPVVILRTQAQALSRRTGGMLTADVTSTSSTNSGESKQPVSHQLLLHAPSINYTEHLLSISHTSDKLYPVEVALPVAISWLPGKVQASPFKVGLEAILDPASPRFSISCSTQEGLLDALRVALNSPPTKAALNSLLARVNESKLASMHAFTPPAGT